MREQATMTATRKTLSDDAPGNQPREGQLFGRQEGKERIGAPSQRWQARLTDEQVCELRQLRKAGYRYSDLALRFGISPSAVSAIVHRQTYKHVS